MTSVLHFLSRAHGYTYDQKPPVSRYPLVSFLFKDKRGYCQQFSGTMALLLRMGGLPARVAAGFTSGTRSGTRNQWQVSDIDAHAWVEVWFPHYGWVRFDPTPTVAPARGGATSTAIVKPLPGSGGALPGSSTRQSQAASHTVEEHAPLVRWRSEPAADRRRRSRRWRSWPCWRAVCCARTKPLRRCSTSSSERWRAPGARSGAGVTLAGLEHRFRDSPAAAGYVRALRLERYGGVRESPSRRGRRALREQLRRDLGLTGRLRALWALPPRPPRRRWRAEREP